MSPKVAKYFGAFLLKIVNLSQQITQFSENLLNFWRKTKKSLGKIFLFWKKLVISYWKFKVIPQK